MKRLLSLHQVHGSSMEPTFRQGQYIVASHLSYLWSKPRVGEVVVVSHSHSSRLILKRIAGINGTRYYLAGDNPDKSIDSRHFGPIALAQILGKVILSGV